MDSMIIIFCAVGVSTLISAMDNILRGLNGLYEITIIIKFNNERLDNIMDDKKMEDVKLPKCYGKILVTNSTTELFSALEAGIIYAVRRKNDIIDFIRFKSKTRLDQVNTKYNPLEIDDDDFRSAPTFITDINKILFINKLFKTDVVRQYIFIKDTNYLARICGVDKVGIFNEFMLFLNNNIHNTIEINLIDCKIARNNIRRTLDTIFTTDGFLILKYPSI
jgi:hypothetical protein